jgi:hypothetical protein
MKLTIDKLGHLIVARDESGNVIARENPYCNPSALAQVILSARMTGGEIDWDESQIAKPESFTVKA